MFTFTTGRAPRLNTRPRLRRIAAVLSVAVAGVLAWAAAVPAASAAIIPVPGAGAGYRPAPAATGGTVQVITASGMPGWQITLIAVAAALAAATAAIFADRARATRRAITPTG